MSLAPSTRQIVEMYQRAAVANLRTGGREGNVVVIDPTPQTEVFVAGDLHGHRNNFERLLGVADLAAFPERHLVLQEVCHGGPTYPEGGCMSHEMLEEVAQLKCAFPDRVHFLVSNHELAELTDFPIMKAGRMLNVIFRAGLQEKYGDGADDVRAAYSEFIASCPVGVRIGDEVFVCHSLPAKADEEPFDVTVLSRPIEPADLTGKGAVFRLVWGRDFREENVSVLADLIGVRGFVTGHEPCPGGFQTPSPRQVIVDCCGSNPCYWRFDASYSSDDLAAGVVPLQSNG